MIAVLSQLVWLGALWQLDILAPFMQSMGLWWSLPFVLMFWCLVILGCRANLHPGAIDWIITMGPSLGLLGTVWGFKAMLERGLSGSITSEHLLAVALAMNTTAAGLYIAMFAFTLYKLDKELSS